MRLQMMLVEELDGFITQHPMVKSSKPPFPDACLPSMCDYQYIMNIILAGPSFMLDIACLGILALLDFALLSCSRQRLTGCQAA